MIIIALTIWYSFDIIMVEDKGMTPNQQPRLDYENNQRSEENVKNRIN